MNPADGPKIRLVAQWIEHLPPEQGVGGSSPLGRAKQGNLNLNWSFSRALSGRTEGRNMALEHQSNPNSSLPIEDAFAEFFLYQRSMRHSERTLEFYRHTLGKFRRWMEANNVSDVALVEPAKVRRFALELADSGLADSTVHAYMRAVRAFFRFLEREELVERTPMRNVRMPKVEKKILPAFTDAEVEKLLAASEGQDFRNLRNRLLVLLL